MSRVLIKDNSIDSKVIQDKDMKGIKKQLQITRSYEEALALFLAPGRNAPRRIPHDENVVECIQSPLSVKQEHEEASTSMMILKWPENN